MKQRAALLIILVAGFTTRGSALAEPGPAISLAEFRQQLDDLETRIAGLSDHPEKTAEIGATIPQQIKVNTDGREVTISFRDLKNDLATFAKGDAAQRAALLPHLQEYVHTLAAEAAQYDQLKSGAADARAKLDNILARKEFNRVRGPNVFDVWLNKVLNWIGRRLRRTGSGTWPVLQVLVFSLAAIALGALLVWTIKRLTQPAGEDLPREIIPFAPSAKGWRTWLAEARESEKQQDWHNAIHLAYWAGISYLEEHGAWKPNRARTPREYLRLLGAWTPQHSPLAALTRKFEAVWYGHRPAGQPDFQETLGELERLGCR